MIKNGFKFLSSLKSIATIQVPTAVLKFHLPSIRYASTLASGAHSPIKPSTKLPFIINTQLNKADKIQDLIFVYNKFKLHLNLINYTLLLKCLSEKIKTNDNQLFTETYFNEIVGEIILKLEREDVSDPRTLSNLYHYINRFPFNNRFKTRINFLLEQKGMLHYQEMKSEELSSFAHTLAKLGKKQYFQAILSFVSSRITLYNIRTMSTILYDSCILDIKTPELAKQFQSYFLRQKDIKFTPQDYSFLFYYCGKNSDIMNNRAFFETLEKYAPSQVNFCNCICITNIFHGLSFYDKKMVTSNFYEMFESKILSLLPEMSNQGLSLIFRGYCIFDQGTDAFLRELAEEAERRVNKLDSEAFSTIFYMLTKAKLMQEEMIKSFTNKLLNGKISELQPKQFEHIFYSYYNLIKDNDFQITKELKDAFSKYITQHIDSFNLQNIGNIANMCPLLLSKEKQHDLSIHIQKEILKIQSIDIESVDLKSICEIAYFVLNEASAEVLGGFITKIIDLSLLLAQKKLVDKEELAKLHFLRYYGKLLIVLTPKERILAEDLSKRYSLFELMEQWLVKAYKENPRVPEDFVVENLLMNFIISFYSVLESPLNETKDIFKRSLKEGEISEFKPGNLTFLIEKTDLIIKTFSRQ